MKVSILTNTGITGETTLSDAVFAATVNQQLLSQAIYVYRSNARQGTSATKTRSQVTATTKKWFKQKGTGNARHGAKSAPIFVGGGVAHGPNGNANWSKTFPSALKRKALQSALTLQAKNIFVSDYVNELTGKTQEAAALLAPLAENYQRILIVVKDAPEKTLRALRNLNSVVVVPSYQLTALEVAHAHAIIMTNDAVADLESRILGQEKAVSKASNKATSEKATPAPKKTVKKTTTKTATKATAKTSK